MKNWLRKWWSARKAPKPCQPEMTLQPGESASIGIAEAVSRKLYELEAEGRKLDLIQGPTVERGTGHFATDWIVLADGQPAFAFRVGCDALKTEVEPLPEATIADIENLAEGERLLRELRSTSKENGKSG